MIETFGTARPVIRRLRMALALMLALLCPASSLGQPSRSASGTFLDQGRLETSALIAHRRPQDILADHRATEGALAALQPQRKGVVDAFVVVAALDSDAVFGREARETGRVLSRRFDAAQRTIVLGDGSDGAPPASPAHLALALARVAELIDKDEDVLILYTTSHGSAKAGLAYRDQARGIGAIPPRHLAGMLDGLGLANRLVLLSACYSGVFVPKLASETSVVITAAAADRSSFGCSPGNDWTFFGDALINNALRKPQPLATAFKEASARIGGWEEAGKLTGSNPQISVGKKSARWLDALEKRTPAETTTPVGKSPAPPIALGRGGTRQPAG